MLMKTWMTPPKPLEHTRVNSLPHYLFLQTKHFSGHHQSHFSRLSYAAKWTKQIWFQNHSHEYSHSLYCCSWLNSAGLKHTQLLSPIMPWATDWSLSLGVSQPTSHAEGTDGYPWIDGWNKTEVKRIWEIMSVHVSLKAPDNYSWVVFKCCSSHSFYGVLGGVNWYSSSQSAAVSGVRLFLCYWLLVMAPDKMAQCLSAAKS